MQTERPQPMTGGVSLRGRAAPAAIAGRTLEIASLRWQSNLDRSNLGAALSASRTGCGARPRCHVPPTATALYLPAILEYLREMKVQAPAFDPSQGPRGHCGQ